MSAARTFRSTQFGSPGVAPQSLGIPTAAYPGRVATNSDLMVAVDRQQTRLALPLNSTDTAMTVTDPSIIVANCLLTIDSEIVRVTGTPAGNVVPIARAFDGTTAAVHLASATVSGFIDAWHHNALVAEVKAIETALGPNLSGIPASLLIVSTAFDYPPQTPGGSLTAGSNVITMNPVPRGLVTGGTAYISGGTGTAEVVPLTGVSGATVIFTAANTHSGAWTIRSATAGIQEAIDSTQGGRIYIPHKSDGTYHTCYTTITLRNPVNNDWELFGDGPGYSAANGQTFFSATTILAAFKNAPLISCIGSAETTRSIYLHDFSLIGPAAGDASSGSGIQATNLLRLVIQYVHISRFDGNGITLTNSYGAHLYDLFVIENGAYGLALLGQLASTTQVWNCTFVTNCKNGGTVIDLANVLVSPVFAYQLSFVGCNFEGPAGHPWGVPATRAYCMNISGDTEALTVSECYFDNAIGGNSGCLFLQGNVNGFKIDGNWFSASATGFGIQLVKDGPVGSITNNTFDGTPKAIWTPVDTGVRHQLQIFPNYYYTGSVPVFGSALLSTLGNGWWMPGAGTAGGGTHPTVGTWLRGDKVYDVTPSSGAFTGVICVTTGSPGTWKTFGAIS